MCRTTGIFYNGISSVPNQVELLLNDEIDVLQFHTDEAGEITWPLDKIEVEKFGTSIEIKQVNFPLQSVKIDNEEFISALHKLRKEKGHISLYHKLIGLGAKAHAAIALVILGVIALVYVYIMPWVAEKAVIIIPESYENSIGVTFFNQFVEYNSVDSARSKAVTQFAAQLNLHNTKQLKFTVVRSETVNAFALPDGNIVIFTGIIDVMDDYNELAGLIGHEAAHVNNRHSMKMMCRNLSGYIFLSSVLSDVNGVMAVIGDNIHTLQSLTYSRRFEHEADVQGMEILASNNIDPKVMSKLFSRLLTKYDTMLPEFLSSHPLTQDRIDFINNQTTKSNTFQTDNSRLRELFLKVKN